MIGSISESADTKDKSLRFELDAAGDAELEGKPGVFSLKARPLDQQLKCFRQDSSGVVEVEGSVSSKWDMLPAQDATYSSMMKGKLQVRGGKKNFFFFSIFFLRRSLK